MKERGYFFPVQVLGHHLYRVYEDMPYHSARYDKWTTVKKEFTCDGATGAMDILCRGWIHHDWLTASGLTPHLQGAPYWDDGTPCTRWESSTVLADCLKEDGYTFRAPFWRLATWVAGLF